MPRREPTREVPKADARRSLRMAHELVETAEWALGSKRWHAAGLDAIHAGICGADAALIAIAGVRSVSQDHGAVVELLAAHSREFTATQRRQLTGLLKEKNNVAYEQRPLTDVEARRLVDQSRRFVKWAGVIVERQLS
jgi:hypothetical protein